MFGKRAEALARYLTKGTAIDVIIADPHIETWTKQDKTTGHKLVGRVLELEFAGGGRDAGSGQASSNAQHAVDHRSGTAAPARGFNDIDDDLPF
jgi:single-strand DNA-binding protein